MTFLDAALSSPSVKMDFGCGKKIVHSEFLGVDFLPTKFVDKESRGRYFRENFFKWSPGFLNRFSGKISFATMHHVLCCFPRENVLSIVKSVRDFLEEGGTFLLTDHNLDIFLTNGISNQTYQDWMNWSRDQMAEKSGFPGSERSDIVNFTLRGEMGREIKWRYDSLTMYNLLGSAGFSEVHQVSPDDPRHVPGFSTLRPDEDLVFVCKK